jgi:hypothetical protein
MPQVFEDIDEATLPEAARLLSADVRLELRRWWLVVASNNTRTPNWDVASTCMIEGKAGIMLVEAKAHDQELIKEETGRKNIEAPVSGNARRNLLRIDWAIRDASAALADDTGLTWALSRDWNYQMSNRFAWAWKLADLGMPVVLVYLGFLRACEMKRRQVQAVYRRCGLGDRREASQPSPVRRRGLGAALDVPRAAVHPADPVARRAPQFVAPA